MNFKNVDEFFDELTNSYVISKIFHSKTGKSTFLLHIVPREQFKDWVKSRPNHREVSKEVFDKIKEHKILPEVLFENLSASFPDRKFDYNALPTAICEQLNSRFNDR